MLRPVYTFSDEGRTGLRYTEFSHSLGLSTHSPRVPKGTFVWINAPDT